MSVRTVVLSLLTEATAVADDVTIHTGEDMDTARFYFEIGHGNDMYHVSEFDVEYTNPMSHELWVLAEESIDRHEQVRRDQLEFDPNDEEAMRDYLENYGELPSWTHNTVWGQGVDKHWKGHYEGDTGRLSVVNPGFKLTGQLLGMLRAAFSPKEIHVFQ